MVLGNYYFSTVDDDCGIDPDTTGNVRMRGTVPVITDPAFDRAPPT